MSTVASKSAAPDGLRTFLVGLVGNPNTGKTTVFNELTGYRQRVGNYPGVTVERKTGRLTGADGAAPPIEIIDLPGTYGLSAQSRDEMVVIDTLVGHGGERRPDLIVSVIDAVNLRRNLFLTSQVMELGVPVIAALNMMDLARSRSVRIDVAALSAALGIPVNPIVATRGEGIEELTRAIVAHIYGPSPRRHPAMPAPLNSEVDDLQARLRRRSASGAVNGARLSEVELLQVLLGPGGYGESRLQRDFGTSVTDDLAVRRTRLAAAGIDPPNIEAEVRYAWIDDVVRRAVDARAAKKASTSDVVDRVLTHRAYGMIILVLLMGVVFQSIYAWAAPLMNLVTAGFERVGGWVTEAVPAGALQSLLVNGVAGGVGSVLTFLPQIMILFFFLAVLEDCGYMARAAFLMDRAMGFCGLNGKALIPLVSSFACAVPGIMTTRTIENRADRFVTILVAPLMSCSARLPVYVLLIAAFVPATALLGGVVNLQAMVLLAMYAVGVVVAIGAALFMRRIVFRHERRAFLMELPSYKWPSAKTVFYRMYEQAREFVRQAGTIIFAVSILIWALGYYPRPAAIAERFERERQQSNSERGARNAELEALDRAEAGEYLRQSVLGRIGQTIEPLVRPLGWDWRIGMAIAASFPAREVIIATLGTIYNLGEGQSEESADLQSALRTATWPDGRPVFNLPVALSIMVFFALCMQCASTLAVIKRETNSWRWPIATFSYMTILGYIGAFVTYRVTSWLV